MPIPAEPATESPIAGQQTRDVKADGARGEDPSTLEKNCTHDKLLELSTTL